MVGKTERDRMKALEDRIDTVRKRHAPSKPHQEEHYSQAQVGWRMVTELVAGLGIGFGMGYGLDALFGTMPIFLVLFTLLGFGAGVRVMLRTATEVRVKRSDAAPKDEPDTGG